jgi:transcriptional regulator with XRE-family HTH domain
MNIGKTVAKLRAAKQLSQADLAKRTKLSRPYIVQIENGKRGVRVITLQKLAKVLGVEPGDLMK